MKDPDLESALRDMLRERAEDITDLPDSLTEFDVSGHTEPASNDDLGDLHHRGRRSRWLPAAAAAAIVVIAGGVVGVRQLADQPAGPAAPAAPTVTTEPTPAATTAPSASTEPSPTTAPTTQRNMSPVRPSTQENPVAKTPDAKTPKASAPSIRKAALPGAWQQALKSSSFSLDGVSTMPLAMTGGGDIIATRDFGKSRDVVAVTPGKAVRKIFTVPDPDQNQVLGASVDGSWVLLPVSRLPRNSHGVDETVVRIDLVNLSTGVHREIAHTSQADAINGGKTTEGAVIYRGHVYFDTRPTYASQTRVINDYDIADDTTTAVTSTTAGKPESMPQLSAAGVTWMTTANKTARVTKTDNLPPIVAAAIADRAGRSALSTDGSAYAWLAGNRTIGWWAPGDSAASYVTLPNTDQWSSASFGQYDQPTVAGKFVFLDGYVIDMHTATGAAINRFGGHDLGAFGVAPQNSSHGIVLGYAATGGSADQTFEILRLDTTKLPDLKPAQ